MIEHADDIPSPERICGPESEVVAKCEEFTLYANGWLESSPKVERALWRATLGISNRRGSEERLDLALALLHLSEYAAGHRDVEPEALLEWLAATLGALLIPALSVGQMLKKKPNGKTFYDSPRRRLDAAKIEADTAAVSVRNAIWSVKSAMLAIARWKNSRPEPGSNQPGAIVWEMQLVAKDIFRDTRKRPTKWEIRSRLDEQLSEGEILAQLEVVREQLKDIGRAMRLTEDQIRADFEPVRKRMKAKGYTEDEIRARLDGFRKRQREAEEKAEKEEHPLTEDEIEQGVIRARQEMEEKGWRICSKDAESRWRERFEKAGLGNLPN